MCPPLRFALFKRSSSAPIIFPYPAEARLALGVKLGEPKLGRANLLDCQGGKPMVRQEGGGREGGKGIPEGSDLSRRIMRKCIFTFFQKMVKVFPLLFSFSCDDTKEKKKPFFVPSSRSPAYSCLLLLLPGLAIILCMCYTRTPFFPFSPFMTGHALNWREKESGRNFQDARKIWKCNFGFSTEKVKVSQLS